MDLLALSAEERYAQLMQRNPALIQTLSVKHVSSVPGHTAGKPEPHQEAIHQKLT